MRLWHILVLVLVGASLTSYADVHSVRPGTKPARDVHESGFLGADAALLRKGGEGELVYKKPDVDWSSYDKMLLDPVTFWRPPGEATGISAQDAQTLINYFTHLIYEQFSKEIQMVNHPEPNTMRVKVAIVKATQSHAALDMVSTVVPALRAVSALKNLVTGKPTFVGQAEIEVKVTDAMSGELLAEAVADRVGNKTLDADHLHSWGDVEEAMRFWTVHAAYNLCELQDKPNCVEPADASLLP